MKILFQLDDFDINKLRDTSTMVLIYNALLLGHDVHYAHPDSLSLNGDDISAKITKITLNHDKIIAENPIADASHIKLSEAKRQNLHDFDICFIRQNPPFDMKYISNLYILNILKEKHRVFLSNDAMGILRLSEKISPLFFTKDYIPKTLLSNDEQEIENFLNQQKKIIAKSLYGYGGKEIIASDKISEIIAFKQQIEQNDGQVIYQEFLEEANLSGSLRVDIYFDEIIGAIRLKNENSFITNGNFIYEFAEISKMQKKIATEIIAIMQDNAIHYAGIDFIGDKLMEINITCPAILKVMEKVNPAGKYAQKLINKVCEASEKFN